MRIAPRPLRRVPGPRRTGRLLTVFISLLLFISLALGGIGLWGFGQFSATGPLSAEKPFTVERGMNALDVARRLEADGIIRDARIFTIAAWLTDDYRRIKAGEYMAPVGVSMAALMDIIVEGREYTYRITIPEGWTSQMAAERINADVNLSGPAVAVPPEGSLLPDTYSFRKGFGRQALVDEMMLAQAKLVETLWPQRASGLPLANPREAIILASIVEKETSVPAERTLVAGVFVNRLRKSMRLQSDPTVIYGIVGGKGKLDRPISKVDLREVSAYNTYRIPALPPGPIANPGRDSIAAVLNPAETDALYFVADGTGGHAFAATLDDHNANVKEWRALQKRLAEEAEADAQEAQNAGQPQPDGEKRLPVPLPRPRPQAD